MIKLVFYLKQVIQILSIQKLASIFDLSDDTIKYMGIEGRKNIIQKFNVEKMCFSTYSEYKRLLN